MTPRPRLTLTLVATLAGCASGGSHASSPVALDRLPVTEFRDIPRDLSIEVTVDSLGHADARTLRIVGAVGADTRAAIERWAGYARFTPARQSGHPVAATYRTRIKTSTRVVRVEKGGA